VERGAREVALRRGRSGGRGFFRRGLISARAVERGKKRGKGKKKKPQDPSLSCVIARSRKVERKGKERCPSPAATILWLNLGERKGGYSRVQSVCPLARIHFDLLNPSGHGVEESDPVARSEKVATLCP